MRALAPLLALTATLLPVSASGPASAQVSAQAPAAAVTIQFHGDMTVGCLNCSEPVTVSGVGVVAGDGGPVRSGWFSAIGWEDTTPDPCPVLLQGEMDFAVGGVTGRLYWLRSTDGLVFVATGVNGNGMKDWAGSGTGVLLADPARVALESCGHVNRTYPVHAAVVVAPPMSTR